VEHPHPIKAYCARHGISQKDLAARARISYGYLNQIVNGHEFAGRDAAKALRDAMGGEITLDELLDWKANSEPA